MNEFFNQMGGLEVLLGYGEAFIPKIKAFILGYLESCKKNHKIEQRPLLEIYLEKEALVLNLAQKHGKKVTKICPLITISENIWPPLFKFIKDLIDSKDDLVDGQKITIEILKIFTYSKDDKEKKNPSTELVVSVTPRNKEGRCSKPLKAMRIEDFILSFIEKTKKQHKENESSKKRRRKLGR